MVDVDFASLLDGNDEELLGELNFGQQPFDEEHAFEAFHAKQEFQFVDLHIDISFDSLVLKKLLVGLFRLHAGLQVAHIHFCILENVFTIVILSVGLPHYQILLVLLVGVGSALVLLYLILQFYSVRNVVE